MYGSMLACQAVASELKLPIYLLTLSSDQMCDDALLQLMQVWLPVYPSTFPSTVHLLFVMLHDSYVSPTPCLARRR